MKKTAYLAATYEYNIQLMIQPSIFHNFADSMG